MDFGTVQLTAEGHEPFTAIARGAFMGARKSLGNAVVVGDEVHLAWDAERAMIESIEPRRNSFSRRAAGERIEEQVVAANLDKVVLVTSLRQPEFKHGPRGPRARAGGRVRHPRRARDQQDRYGRGARGRSTTIASTRRRT
ncbi:MAG: hypothetical protein IPJ04_14460 [Candidatus Eisenbacteria bacterium]|nr:hypothetical protein [Candidatus Eisenbacteria bacterium]